MGFWKKQESKYKPKARSWDWWDDGESTAADEEKLSRYDDDYPDEELVHQPTPVDYGHVHGGYNRGTTKSSGWGGYTYSWYKPKYDMSISLATRVRQLIMSVTGKDLRLAQAEGWGNDDKYFYYNPEDLQNTTDDEVLGRILHQLGKELHIDKGALVEMAKADAPYRHLIQTLEENRSDRQLQSRYAGVGYYAAELWDNRKFTDNPINQYQEEIDIQKNPEGVRTAFSRDQDLKEMLRDYARAKDEWDEAIEQHNAKVRQQQNPAWEFCFNLNAYQNGETDYDFAQPNIEANFKKALPFVEEYLNATSFADALKVYPEIKKYYPVPDAQQQQQMDGAMGQTEGLSALRMQQLAEQMAQAMAQGNTNEENLAEELDAEMAAHGRKGSLNPGDRQITKEGLEYRKMYTEMSGVIHNLHYLLRSILKDNEIRRYTRPYKRGKIDAKRMYKFLATDDLRIFKKQKVVSKQKYTMAIMVDQSGSMSGTNSAYAARGALVLAEVFEMLGFPYEIIGFDDTAYIYKSIKGALHRELLPGLRSTGGGTNDVNALTTIKKHLYGFDPGNAHRKGIFIISDGEGSDPKDMKTLVSEIETHNNASVFGIGIGEMRLSSLKQSYNNYMLIKDVKDLPKELVGLMRTQFRRGA